MERLMNADECLSKTIKNMPDSSEFKAHTIEEVYEALKRNIDIAISMGQTYCLPRIVLSDIGYDKAKQLFEDLKQLGYTVRRGLTGELFWVSWDVVENNV